jgi:hypothetical protein
MRNYILVLVALTVLSGCMTVTLDEQPEVREVIESGHSKAELFQLSNEWLVDTFSSADAVIQFKDKQEGVVMGKGYFQYFDIAYGQTRIWFTLKMEVKEQKARISIYDFITEKVATHKKIDGILSKSHWDTVKDRVYAIADDYRSYITETSADW